MNMLAAKTEFTASEKEKKFCDSNMLSWSPGRSQVAGDVSELDADDSQSLASAKRNGNVEADLKPHTQPCI